MLEELSKDDMTWKHYAYLICGDKELSQDLVQDMYIKLYKKEKVNKRYVYRTLQALFIDHLRKQKETVSIESLYYLEENSDRIDTTHLEDCLKRLKWFDREILKMTHSNSLRACEKLTGVNYSVLNYHKTKALKKLKILYYGKR